MCTQLKSVNVNSTVGQISFAYPVRHGVVPGLTAAIGSDPGKRWRLLDAGWFGMGGAGRTFRGVSRPAPAHLRSVANTTLTSTALVVASVYVPAYLEPVQTTL